MRHQQTFDFIEDRECKALSLVGKIQFVTLHITCVTQIGSYMHLFALIITFLLLGMVIY